MHTHIGDEMLSNSFVNFKCKLTALARASSRSSEIGVWGLMLGGGGAHISVMFIRQ